MTLWNEKGNFTSDALSICSEIDSVLKPILEKTLSKGMGHAEFCYMVNTEADLLVLMDLRHKRSDTIEG